MLRCVLTELDGYRLTRFITGNIFFFRHTVVVNAKQIGMYTIDFFLIIILLFLFPKQNKNTYKLFLSKYILSNFFYQNTRYFFQLKNEFTSNCTNLIIIFEIHQENNQKFNFSNLMFVSTESSNQFLKTFFLTKIMLRIQPTNFFDQQKSDNKQSQQQ